MQFPEKLHAVCTFLDSLEAQGFKTSRVAMHPQTAEKLGLCAMPLSHRGRLYEIMISTWYPPNDQIFAMP